MALNSQASYFHLWCGLERQNNIMRGYGLLFLLALASADNGFRSNSPAHVDYDDCWSRPSPQGRQGSYAQNIRSNHIQVAHPISIPHNSPIRKPLPPLGMTYIAANEMFENVYDILHPRLSAVSNLSEADKTYLTSIYILHHLTQAQHNSICSYDHAPIDYHAEVTKAMQVAQQRPYKVQRILAKALASYVASVAKLVKILKTDDVQDYCSHSYTTQCDGYVNDIIATKDNRQELMHQVDLIISIGHSSMKFQRISGDLEQITSIASATTFFHGQEQRISELVEVFEDTMRNVYPCPLLQY